MVQFFKNRNEVSGMFVQEDKKLYNVITCPADILDLDHNETISLTDKKNFKQYALNHGELNMIQLFNHFNYPIPETEEEKNDPRFCLKVLYKNDSNGNLIPRENIYYYEKFVKGYKNPFKSFYTILNDGTIIDNNNIKPLNDENNINGFKKIKKLDNKINGLTKKIGRKTIYNKQDINRNVDNIKELQYNLCIKHYAKQLGSKDIKQISLDEITTLGQIYYLIKTASEQSEIFNNPFKNINEICYEEDDDEDDLDFGFGLNLLGKNKNKKKDENKKSFIETLLKNSRIADNNFGYLSEKPGESQIIKDNFSKIDLNPSQNNNKDGDSQILLNKFQKLQIESQKMKDVKNDNNINLNNNSINLNNSKKSNQSIYGELGNSLLYNNNRLVLVLKGKRVDFTDIEGKKNRNRFYFDFYVENKLLNTVEVIYNINVAKEDLNKFKNIMGKVKINEEIIIAFAYNPTLYFNIKYLKYDIPRSGVESVYYIDSSKENPKVNEIYEYINK